VTDSLRKKNVDATIHATFPAKNGDVILAFDKKDDLKSITKNIEEELHIKAYGRQPFLPKIKITHIPGYITTEAQELTQVITDSNTWLKEDTKSFTVLFTYKVKDHISAVCKVSPNTRHQLIQQSNKIRVGMRMCPVVDRIHVLKCGKCLKYGHKMVNCLSDHFTCSWCSEKHKTSECSQKDNQSTYQCVNCSRNGERETGHSAHSKSCQTFVKMRKLVIEKTDWGEDPLLLSD
jgi:hypothetical protein